MALSHIVLTDGSKFSVPEEAKTKDPETEATERVTKSPLKNFLPNDENNDTTGTH